jgi:hypothetical protein
MPETTKDQPEATASTGSDLRDIAGAWLVCALIAAVALALSGDLNAPPASAPTAVALMQPSR